MPINPSKPNQQRYWNKWRKSSAIVAPNSFQPDLVTVPPPTAEVSRMIWRITCLLNNLEADITGPPKLLAEISEARHQTNRCEYYIAKNYLGWVIELGSTSKAQVDENHQASRLVHRKRSSRFLHLAKACEACNVTSISNPSHWIVPPLSTSGVFYLSD